MKDQDKLPAFLRQDSIGSEIYYPVPLHGGRGPGHCPGVHFRRTRPWIQATGEWRAEGSSLDLQECFKDLGYRAGDFPVSEAAAASVISIPIYPELTDEQKDYVAGKIVEFYG